MKVGDEVVILKMKASTNMYGTALKGTYPRFFEIKSISK